MPIKISKNVGKVRLRQGLFQKEAAKLSGVDEVSIVNCKTGKTEPRKMNLEKLKANSRS